MRPGSKPICALVLMAVALGCLQPAAAQNRRDPTIPPFGSGMSDGRDGAGDASTRGLRAPLSVIFVNGQFHLVVGTRLYAEGQKLGQARIERITETEVWLRDGRGLRKVSNFVGVKRHNAVETAAALDPVCGASAAKGAKAAGSSKESAACDSGQP